MIDTLSEANQTCRPKFHAGAFLRFSSRKDVVRCFKGKLEPERKMSNKKTKMRKKKSISPKFAKGVVKKGASKVSKK